MFPFLRLSVFNASSYQLIAFDSLSLKKKEKRSITNKAFPSIIARKNDGKN